MIITTTETIAGKNIDVTHGLVRGNTIRARHLGRDITAGFKSLVGGEIKGYVTMMNEARDVALERMQQEAEGLGANAIVGVRFTTAQTMDGASEILAYGTAVTIS